MRVVVGPVPTESARAWLGYARAVLADLGSLDVDACVIDDDVATVFAGYLSQWERAARGKQFLWEADIPAEMVEYHMHAFQKVAAALAAREEISGVSAAPDEGEAFYGALVSGVIAALELEGPTHAEFATHLEEFWPGRSGRD